MVCKDVTDRHFILATAEIVDGFSAPYLKIVPQFSLDKMILSQMSSSYLIQAFQLHLIYLYKSRSTPDAVQKLHRETSARRVNAKGKTSRNKNIKYDMNKWLHYLKYLH